MLKKLILLTLLFISLLFSNQDSFTDSITKEFLITKSTKSYNEAKEFATNISKDLNITLNLRGLSFHKQNFLTLSKEECSEFGYPCYIPRGRYDDGEYISIEHSNAYQEFKDGYYIVVVATGENLSTILKKIQKEIKDAYIKKANIYMGCIH